MEVGCRVDNLALDLRTAKQAVIVSFITAKRMKLGNSVSWIFEVAQYGLAIPSYAEVESQLTLLFVQAEQLMQVTPRHLKSALYALP